MERLLTAKDIAIQFGVHIQTVRRWVREGKMPANRPTYGKYYFNPIDVDKFAHANTKREAPAKPP